MTTTNQKNEILQSLDSLDQIQKSKVLEYIKELLYTTEDASEHNKLKREAMKEIRQALSKKRKLNLAF